MKEAAVLRGGVSDGADSMARRGARASVLRDVYTTLLLV